MLSIQSIASEVALWCYCCLLLYMTKITYKIATEDISFRAISPVTLQKFHKTALLLCLLGSLGIFVNVETGFNIKTATTLLNYVTAVLTLPAPVIAGFIMSRAGAGDVKVFALYAVSILPTVSMHVTFVALGLYLLVSLLPKYRKGAPATVIFFPTSLVMLYLSLSYTLSVSILPFDVVELLNVTLIAAYMAGAVASLAYFAVKYDATIKASSDVAFLEKVKEKLNTDIKLKYRKVDTGMFSYWEKVNNGTDDIELPFCLLDPNYLSVAECLRVLELPKEFTKSDLQSAFKKKAFELHPDSVTKAKLADESGLTMDHIMNAKEILSKYLNVAY